MSSEIKIRMPWQVAPRVTLNGGEGYSADSLVGVPTQCGVSMRLEGEEWWRLPVDPVVTVRGSNVVVKRQVLKPAVGDKRRRGTVKELWSQGDYEISISGVLTNEVRGALPQEMVRRLRRYCESRESVEVMSTLLTLFGIDRIVVERFEMPHTVGLENQRYVLTCVSDDFDREQLLIAEE